MSNLLTSLASTAQALRVFERALVVAQNNVVNASTPGYARQRLALQAAEFDPNLGLIGGVRVGEVQSARDLYSEQAVRRQMGSLGYFSQTAQCLASIESAFNVTGATDVPGALNRLYRSFSAWSLEPNNASARQAVIDRATELTQTFHQAASRLADASADTDLQLRQTVDHINELGAALLEYNAARRRGGLDDEALDTKIQTALEELSELVDCTVLPQPDGSVTILMGGQVPLLIGENLFRLQVSFDVPTTPPPIYAGAPPAARIVSTEGHDVTALVSQGRLASLLEIRNEVLPSLAGGPYHQGDLNVLAKSVADRVNQMLVAGRVSDGPPPESGVPLFAYETSSSTSVIESLRLDPGVTSSKLAAILPGPPYSGNGTALLLSQLASPKAAADKVDGLSFVEYYGRIAGRVGQLLTAARDNEDFKTQMVAQAKSLRAELSAVSLDEEAMLVIEFQRAYQASAQLVSTLSELTATTINLLR